MLKFRKIYFRKKYWCHGFIFFGMFSLIALTIWLPRKRVDIRRKRSDPNLISGGDPRSPKVKIVFWTGYFQNYEFSAYGIDKELFTKCEVTWQLTFDRNLSSESDALIFHVRDLDILDLPTFRRPNQFWIFYMLESGDNTRVDLTKYENIFNWTMTYRQDSDVYHPYGEVKKVQFPIPYYGDISSKKFKLVAWVVSNCFTHSNRESFVDELATYIQIDKYGACGNLTCVGSTTSECYAHLASSYKFYLAFENSLCTEYVTEKFFESLKHNMVPVVYGRVNYTAIAPPHSFIDARQFQSGQALANYLTYLDHNAGEYRRYLQWKRDYKVYPSNGWCRLCQKLQDSPVPKIYSNIWRWWKQVPDYTRGQGLRDMKTLNNVDASPHQACLSYQDFGSESWVQKFRKQHFILPSV